MRIDRLQLPAPASSSSNPLLQQIERYKQMKLVPLNCQAPLSYLYFFCITGKTFYEKRHDPLDDAIMDFFTVIEQGGSYPEDELQELKVSDTDNYRLVLFAAKEIAKEKKRGTIQRILSRKLGTKDLATFMLDKSKENPHAYTEQEGGFWSTCAKAVTAVLALSIGGWGIKKWSESQSLETPSSHLPVVQLSTQPVASYVSSTTICAQKQLWPALENSISEQVKQCQVARDLIKRQNAVQSARGFPPVHFKVVAPEDHLASDKQYNWHSGQITFPCNARHALTEAIYALIELTYANEYEPLLNKLQRGDFLSVEEYIDATMRLDYKGMLEFEKILEACGWVQGRFSDIRYEQWLQSEGAEIRYSLLEDQFYQVKQIESKKDSAGVRVPTCNRPSLWKKNEQEIKAALLDCPVTFEVVVEAFKTNKDLGYPTLHVEIVPKDQLPFPSVSIPKFGKIVIQCDVTEPVKLVAYELRNMIVQKLYEKLRDQVRNGEILSAEDFAYFMEELNWDHVIQKHAQDIREGIKQKCWSGAEILLSQNFAEVWLEFTKSPHSQYYQKEYDELRLSSDDETSCEEDRNKLSNGAFSTTEKEKKLEELDAINIEDEL